MKNLYDNELPARIYDDWQEGRWGNRDLVLWTELAKQADGPILELACGTGRLVLPLAREGLDVTGLDLSQNMLTIARQKLAQEPAEVQARLKLVDGDMSKFSLDRKFGLIFIAFRSFQNLLERENQRSCLECCREHLMPKGRFALNIFNPNLSKISQPGEVHFDFGESLMSDGNRLRHTADTTYDTVNQLLSARMNFDVIDASGKVSAHEYPLELRYYFRFEMEWMLEACGFEVEALYGNFDKSPLQADSPEMIFVARRKK
jgi:SAM-dependent methyltransferase